jgi:hypothetical protein
MSGDFAPRVLVVSIWQCGAKMLEGATAMDLIFGPAAWPQESAHGGVVSPAELAYRAISAEEAESARQHCNCVCNPVFRGDIASLQAQNAQLHALLMEREGEIKTHDKEATTLSIAAKTAQKASIEAQRRVEILAEQLRFKNQELAALRLENETLKDESIGGTPPGKGPLMGMIPNTKAPLAGGASGGVRDPPVKSKRRSVSRWGPPKIFPPASGGGTPMVPNKKAPRVPTPEGPGMGKAPSANHLVRDENMDVPSMSPTRRPLSGSQPFRVTTSTTTTTTTTIVSVPPTTPAVDLRMWSDDACAKQIFNDQERRLSLLRAENAGLYAIAFPTVKNVSLGGPAVERPTPSLTSDLPGWRAPPKGSWTAPIPASSILCAPTKTVNEYNPNRVG